ncbi:MAG: hypothetical protein IJS83_03710 [Acholeplasmatales bacterium]|nr:hypothetical protein [Acholeplasmatales bacterium]
MKSLILVALFGKCRAYLEKNGKLEVYDENADSKCYSTIKFNGPNGINMLPDEIPYSKGNRTLDDISYTFGAPTIPYMDIGIRLAQKLGKEIDAVYFISEKTNSTEYDTHIKQMFKNECNRDIYKGTVGFMEIIHSIGMVYSIKEKKSIQILSPIIAYITTPDIKHKAIDSSIAPGIVLNENFCDAALLDEFKKMFSSYLTLFDEKKNLTILRGMYLAGFYGYIYENKEDDVENIYQDRRIKLPFKEIKRFIEEVHIPHYKKLFNANDVLYSVNIPKFKELFSDINLDDKFVVSQDDFILYAKMLLDFNNDISIKAYRLKSSDFICIFGKSIYGRKSSEFYDKQMKFVSKAIKDNRKLD